MEYFCSVENKSIEKQLDLENNRLSVLGVERILMVVPR